MRLIREFNWWELGSYSQKALKFPPQEHEIFSRIGQSFSPMQIWVPIEKQYLRAVYRWWPDSLPLDLSLLLLYRLQHLPQSWTQLHMWLLINLTQIIIRTQNFMLKTPKKKGILLLFLGPKKKIFFFWYYSSNKMTTLWNEWGLRK